MAKGLTKEQTHRILEDFERISLVTKMLTDLSEHQDGVIMKGLIQLIKEECDALYRDIKGMLIGNHKEAKGEKDLT